MNKDIIISAQTHQRIKADLERLDRLTILCQQLEHRIDSLNGIIASLQLRSGSHYTRLASLENDNRQLQENIDKLIETNEKQDIILRSYKDRNAKLLQEVVRQKASKRRAYNNAREAGIWRVATGFMIAVTILVGVTNN